MELIVCHLNADFDCLGSMIGASLLYPGATLSFPGSRERNLRDFCLNHPELLPNFTRPREIDFNQVTRLILVDCQQPSRIGPFADLLRNSGVEVHIYDHHPVTDDSIKADLSHIFPTGATVSLLVPLLQQRGITPAPEQASLMMLGIHEDTGRLLFPTTTPQDYMAGGWLLGFGADLQLADEIMAPELTTPQVELLHDLLSSLKSSEINGVKVSISHASRPWYVGDLAMLAHLLMDMENLDLLLLAVAMADRIFLVARSRLEEVDVGALMRLFDGGGHASAASATVKGVMLEELLQRLERQLRLTVHGRKLVGQIMSSPVRTIFAEATVQEARDLLGRYNYSAMPVMQRGELIGVITRKVAEKTVYHGLGYMPVTEVMQTGVMRARPDTPLTEVTEYMVGGDRRFVPVYEDERLVGVVTRTDLLRHLHGGNRQSETLYDLERLSPQPKERDITATLEKRLPAETVQMLKRLGENGDRLGMPVFAVGGFVRDLMLSQPNLDLDVTVEGDGIFFAETFGLQEGCRVRPHHAFGTAMLIFDDGSKLDVASTRLEYYDSPGVLPTVERASLRHDLYRRDFTINTLALALNQGRFGTLLDFFGAQKDLQSKIIRVLHNLSFVEDPTRAFRAVRFEQRLGFQIEPHTEGLLRSAVKAGLVERIGGKRLQGELLLILKEQEPAPAIKRMAQLGLLPTIHPELRFSADTEKLFSEVKQALAWHRLLYLESSIEEWAVWLLALTDRLDEELYRQVCKRLTLPERLMERLFSQRRHSLARLQRLRQMAGGGKGLPNSRLYKLLHGIPSELLLYGLARTGNEELRRLVSHYLTRLSSVRPLVNGTELKKVAGGAGPWIRHLKTLLLDARLDGEIHSKDEELALAAQLAAEGKHLMGNGQ